MFIPFRETVDDIFQSDSGIVKKLLASAVVSLSLSVGTILKINSERPPEDNLGVGGSILFTVLIVVIVTGVVALLSLSDIAKDKAIKDYTEVIRLKPDDAMAYLNRGAAYAKKEDYDKAIQDYTEAIRLQPDDAEAYANRGSAQKKKGDQAKADADFARAKELKAKE